ncbi:MAG: glycosyltransferase, partial [Candidatus Portnoybacteria bacterium]
KIKLYQESLATLFPIQEPEGFGNVQIESMACGTPVISFDKSAAREAIKNNLSGYIVKDTNQMAKAVKKVEKLDRAKVRKWAEDNFSLEQYIKKHEVLYAGLIKKCLKY